MIISNEGEDSGSLTPPAIRIFQPTEIEFFALGYDLIQGYGYLNLVLMTTYVNRGPFLDRDFGRGFHQRIPRDAELNPIGLEV